jgi:hypothetical protein
MRFIANRLNNSHLRDILPSQKVDIDGVMAAIAYGSNSNDENSDLVGHCIKNKHRLDIWMRYDHTVPVAVPLLERLLQSHDKNIFCKLIPDCFHSKVIWWRGYGAYVGSANLTERAWITNIEAGVFLPEEDLQSHGMASELESFFQSLSDLEQQIPLSSEIIEEMKKLQKIRHGIDEKGKDKRRFPVWGGPSFESKTNAFERQLEAFRREWQSTLTELRNIGEQLQGSSPTWVSEDLPIEWVADQFLHSYYYKKVSDGAKRPYEDFYQTNRHDPQAALTEAISWWSQTSEPPAHEDHTLYESAPFIREALSRENIARLDRNAFSKICYYTHATKDHVIKVSMSSLGRPDIQSLSREKRIPIFVDWVLKERNQKGWDVKQLINFVLYDGKDEDLWKRLYLAGRTAEYRIPHYGLNSLAEIVGWSRPEIAPPRNGRTSKALRALGFDVRVY